MRLGFTIDVLQKGLEQGLQRGEADFFLRQLQRRCLDGRISISDDFDALLDDFAEYM